MGTLDTTIRAGLQTSEAVVIRCANEVRRVAAGAAAIEQLENIAGALEGQAAVLREWLAVLKSTT